MWQWFINFLVIIKASEVLRNSKKKKEVENDLLSRSVPGGKNHFQDLQKGIGFQTMD